MIKIAIIALQSCQSMFDWLFVEWRRFDIAKNEIVADFGSGDRPFLRANILVDKSLTGSEERPDNFLDTGAYVVKCSLDRLPFKDKSIDFIYSSHTVEHLESLGDCLNEMGRVGKKGYITCPSSTREGIIAPRSHLWFVEKEKDTLVFTRKKSPYPENLGDFFEQKVKQKKGYVLNMLDFFFKEDFLIEYCWENKIKFIIKNVFDNVWSKVKDDEKHDGQSGFLFMVRKKLLLLGSIIVRKLFSRKINLLLMICCPICKSELHIDGQNAICKHCKRNYPHKNRRIFDFIVSN